MWEWNNERRKCTLFPELTRRIIHACTSAQASVCMRSGRTNDKACILNDLSVRKNARFSKLARTFSFCVSVHMSPCIHPWFQHPDPICNYSKWFDLECLACRIKRDRDGSANLLVTSHASTVDTTIDADNVDSQCSRLSTGFSSVRLSVD